MNELAGIAVVLGSVIGAGCLPHVVAPSAARESIMRFPRSRIAGVLLSTIGLLWAGWLLFHTPLGRFDQLKPLLYVLVPITIVLTIFFMDELLAARALGGVLILIPAPILALARWHASAGRLVIVGLMYVFVVAGVVLVISPYYFRKAAGFCLRDDARSRVSGVLGVVLGVVVILLGLFVC